MSVTDYPQKPSPLREAKAELVSARPATPTGYSFRNRRHLTKPPPVPTVDRRPETEIDAFDRPSAVPVETAGEDGMVGLPLCGCDAMREALNARCFDLTDYLEFRNCPFCRTLICPHLTWAPPIEIIGKPMLCCDWMMLMVMRGSVLLPKAGSAARLARGGDESVFAYCARCGTLMDDLLLIPKPLPSLPRP